ncbi:hypothetical protein PS627_04354 [Pseudomonas fluorescens]|uniref:DUF998 domain-containing protein n=1 Tax=Pseudomonas fluorescens TaxID=294 RepID=UPI001251E665|nr:DUF998 domain-containing protein [Pseudomonas fluorescens]CAG8871219.1 hypothetical protein PS627_04354 [Pseudomonas fluorescens]
MKTIDQAFLKSGLLIPVWLFLGVALTALAYPGYSHLDQAMSMLGAQGAPTRGVSPWVNNFPLGVLFVLFAVGVARRFSGSWLVLLSAGFVLLHGLASFGTGYFPCDAGCQPEVPSESQRVHNLAGLVMFVSLTAAMGLWAFLGKRQLGSPWFGVFSGACVGVSLVTVLMMGRALDEGQLFGLYQRLNYGVCVLWVAALAVMALRGRVVGN